MVSPFVATKSREVFMPKQVSQEKWEKTDNPLVQLDQSARRLLKKFDNRLESRKKYTLWVTILLEIMSCQMRFLAGIYVSIFLEEDYRNTELDKNVLNFFMGECDTYNELLGLCEGLKKFLKKRKREKYGDTLFNIDYFKLRMKAPPFSHASNEKDAEHFKQYREHIRGIMDSFMEQTEPLQKELEVKWNPKLYTDDLVDFQQNAEKILRKKSRKGRIAKYKSGKCRLPLEEQEKIQLDPIVIPLKKRIRKELKFASIFCFNPKETVQEFPIKYIELTGEGRFFHTKNEELFRDLYFKKGNVVEAPSFSHDFHLWEKDLDLQLYEGDIFELHFLEGMKGANSALVSVLYADTKLKTPLSRRLEVLAGTGVIKELETKSGMRKGNVYATASGKLGRFNYILHCPIYDLGQKEKDTSDRVIEETIENIIKECDRMAVEWLIVPAMGSFWAGQTRRKVAQKWCEKIRNLAEDSRLKRIVFSFTNRETKEIYRKIIFEKIDDKFTGYQFPISRMHSTMMAVPTQIERVQAIVSLATYLYVFVTACSLRGMDKAAGKARKSGAEYFMNDEQKKLITYFRKQMRLDHTEGEFEYKKSINIGTWQQICSRFSSANKDDEWCFSLHEGRYFTEMRNELSHPSGAGHMHDEWYKGTADEGARILKEIIKQHPFFKQETVKLIYVEDFTYDEDEGWNQVQFRDLRGGFDTPPSTKQEVQEVILQKGMVYLAKLEKGRYKFLNLHPFILFARCNTCHRRSIFWLKDITHDGNNNEVEMDYASVECRCVKVKGGTIGDFRMEDLKAKFVGLLKRLDPNKYPSEPLEPTSEKQAAKDVVL
jgi:O-acetyl-ADP-ribose deacetylase (regulator of RNase III)